MLLSGGGGATRPLPGDGSAKEFRRDPEVKMEEVVPKMAVGEAQMGDNPEGDDIDPADEVRRRCKKNSSFYPA